MRIHPIMIVLAVVLLGIVLNDRTPDDLPRDLEPAVLDADLAQLRDCVLPVKQGDPRGDCVRSIQDILRARGAPIGRTGNYFDVTAEGVRQFQRVRGIQKGDGVVDQATLDALTELPSAEVEWDLRHECVSMRHINGRTDSHGREDSQGGCVVELRKLLNEQGAELPDGNRFDEAVDVTVRAFQISMGLEALGVVGPQTKEALYAPRSPEYQLTRSLTCTPPVGCVMYLNRRMTAGLADVDPGNDPARYAITTALSALACRQAKILLGAACQVVVSYIVDTVIDVTTVVDKAQQAHKQGACLIVNLGYPSSSTSWSPLSLGVDGGPQCRD